VRVKEKSNHYLSNEKKFTRTLKQRKAPNQKSFRDNSQTGSDEDSSQAPVTVRPKFPEHSQFAPNLEVQNQEGMVKKYNREILENLIKKKVSKSVKSKVTNFHKTFLSLTSPAEVPKIKERESHKYHGHINNPIKTDNLMAAQNRSAIIAEGLLYDGKFVDNVNIMKDKIVRNYVKNYKVIGDCFAKVSNPIGDSVVIENLRHENQSRQQNFMGVKTKMDYADFKSIKVFRKVLVECGKVAQMKN
jgi:hypothetical protein